MTTDAHRVAIDPTVEGPAPLPEVPEAGLVVASVSSEAADTCGAHLLDFARQWQQEGRKVYLCDACFESPVLHLAAGVENGEGLSDALLYGTSFGRISHRIAQDIALASAGTLVGDPDAVREHGRWDTIVAGFEEAGALLIVSVPAGSEGSVLTAAAATRIHFGAPSEAVATDRMAGDDVLGADVALAEDFISAAVLDDAGVTHVGDSSSSTAPELDTGPEGTDAATDPVEHVAEAGSDDESDPESASMPFKTGAGETIREVEKRSFPILLLIPVIIIVVLALGYFGVIDIPGVTPTDVETPSDALPNS